MEVVFIVLLTAIGLVASALWVAIRPSRNR